MKPIILNSSNISHRKIISNLNKYTMVRVSREKLRESMYSLEDWIDKNCVDAVYSNDAMTLYFPNKTDAMTFKLVWG